MEVETSLSEESIPMEVEETDPNSRTPEAQAFRRAVQEDDVEAAVRSFGDKKYWVKRYGVKRLVDSNNSSFIIKLLKGKSYVSYILRNIFDACKLKTCQVRFE